MSELREVQRDVALVCFLLALLNVLTCWRDVDVHGDLCRSVLALARTEADSAHVVAANSRCDRP